MKQSIQHLIKHRFCPMRRKSKMFLQSFRPPPSYKGALKSGAGFTLIELLVVIAIIAMLASIIMASLTSARVKGRDVKRLADMKNFQKALELYYADNMHYPYSCAAGVWSSFDSLTYSGAQLCSTPNGATAVGTLTQVMAPYIGDLADPKSLGGDSGYLYRNSGGQNDFCMLSYRTPENMNNFPSNFVQTARCGTITNGQCSGTNTIFLGEGIYRAAGC
jgi:prepilin-type N-terminal cleavage/methylation domain-containing protein